MMQGPWLAKKFVTDYLASDIPHRIIDHRNAWQLDSSRLPDPELYVAYEPAGLEVWPTIITIQMNTGSLTRTDYTNWSTDPNYRVTYNLRTYIWVRGEGPEQTTESRDRLTAVVRASMLDHAAMEASAPGFFPYIDADVLMDETSLREEYSDLSYAKGDRVIAGAYLAYELSLNEQITRTKLGDVDSFDVEGENLGWADVLPSNE
jgi:hypothetical protein